MSRNSMSYYPTYFSILSRLQNPIRDFKSLAVNNLQAVLARHVSKASATIELVPPSMTRTTFNGPKSESYI